jgi:peroxiredoxin
MLLLRQIASTLHVLAVGVFNTIMRAPGSVGEVQRGDPAPDFALTGSDGRTYRLRELAGQPVVIAWFPKAFTGG